MVKKSFPRRYRIASQIHESIAPIIPSTFKDGILTIRRIELNHELSTATVFYVYIGSDKKELAQFLEENKEKYRHQLAKKLNMRKTPTICFMYDEGGVAADKMRQFLETVNTENMPNLDTTDES